MIAMTGRRLRALMVAALAGCLAACSPAAEPEPAPAPRPLLNLSGDGLTLVDPDTGASRALDFGLGEAIILTAVSAARGEVRVQAENSECGAGPLEYAIFDGGLTLWFQQDRFEGWALGSDAAQDLRTAAGLGVGSTRAELEAAYVATVAETSLGNEFQAGDLFGILSSPDPQGRVTALWAGVSCIFR